MTKINDKFEIEHLGKTFTTKHFKAISDDECIAIKEEYFERPTVEKVQAQLLKVSKGGVMSNVIHKYFFFDLMAQAKLSGGKWSIKEFFDCNDLIRFTVGKVTNCDSFYGGLKDLNTKIATVLRLSPSGTAPKLSNYPLKSVKSILEKYNPNNNYYDFSCGWGVRLLGSMATGVNYFGTDPNHELVDKLNDLGKMYNEITPAPYDIRCQGSEVFIPEWENKIGLAFSSPPYYDLEDYKIGKQSINNRDYQQWLSEYWDGTVKNIIKYLIKDGFMLLNIKNIKAHNLLDDMKKICEDNGLIYIESLELKNINRVILEQNNKHTNEEILVFKKG